MIGIRYKVWSRKECDGYCEIAIGFVSLSKENIEHLPAEFREVCISPQGSGLKLTLPMSEWQRYPVGAEFDLVPARTQT